MNETLAARTVTTSTGVDRSRYVASVVAASNMRNSDRPTGFTTYASKVEDFVASCGTP